MRGRLPWGDMCISLIGSNERRLGYKLDPHRSHNGMAVATGNTVRVRVALRGNHTLVAGGLASKPNAFGGLHYIDARTMPSGAPTHSLQQEIVWIAQQRNL